MNKDFVCFCGQELDVKAGGGCVMTIGEMLRSFLTKLEWFSTLFPRIPVPVQKTIDTQMKNRPRKPPQKEGKEDEEDGDWHRSRYITGFLAAKFRSVGKFRKRLNSAEHCVYGCMDKCFSCRSLSSQLVILVCYDETFTGGIVFH